MAEAAHPIASPPLLSIEALAAGYGDEPILRDVSFAIPRGSVTTVIGPNGAGKSTLLRAIAGTARCFSGHIRFDGEAIEKLSPVQRLRRGLGCVPQGRCNFPLMSVRENLELGAYGLPKRRAKAAIEEMLELFPLLRKRWQVAAGNLSGGEQQILEMAMVLSTKPRLVLLDEPSLGLSPANQSQVFGTISDIRREGVTVLIVEQNATASLRISDFGIVMELGRKRQEGEAAAILADPALRAAYLGEIANP